MVSDRADEVLKLIEKAAWRSYLPIIGSGKGRVLVDLIHKIRPKRILEVGTLVGYSTILMAKELESSSEIVTVEIDEDEAKVAEENIIEAGVRPRVKVLVGDALELVPHLEGLFDMVFLDADKSEYLDYLRLVEGNLHKGSVVVADNTNISTSSMRRYLDYVRNSGKYESPVNATYCDEMEVSIKL